MLYPSYLVMGLNLLHFVTVSSWNKVQVKGNEKPGPHVLFLFQFVLADVMKWPAEPKVHGIPMTYEAALYPLGWTEIQPSTFITHLKGEGRVSSSKLSMPKTRLNRKTLWQYNYISLLHTVFARV
jgi:hypothetical protein